MFFFWRIMIVTSPTKNNTINIYLKNKSAKLPHYQTFLNLKKIMKKRRLKNEINAGSMADIAFLLLIFFLVTTTIASDQGIMVKLPLWESMMESEPLPDKNVFSVKVNVANDLLVEGKRMEMKELKNEAKTFIMNPQKLPTMPSKPTRAVISLQNDRGTNYQTYLEVYNELKAAYNELWEEKAQEQFAMKYKHLNIAQQKDIRNAIPLIISEAEPTEY